MTLLLASLTALLALLGAGAVIARPFWAFLPVALMFAMEQLLQTYFPFLQAHTSAFNIAVILLAAFAVFLRMTRREPVFAGWRNPVTLLIYLQFCLWAVGMLYATEEAPLPVRFESVGHYLVLFLVILPLTVISLAEFRRILIGMMVVGTIMALLILVNPNTSYYAGRLTLDLGMMGDLKDSIGNPLATASMGATIALIAALIVPQRRSTLMTFIRATAFVLGLGLAIGSGSRGQVLATGVAGILFFPMARRLNNPRNFILSCMGLLVVIAGMIATFQLFIGDQNRKRWDITQMFTDITLRFDMSRDYLDAYLSSPGHWLFGLGTNAWMGIGASQYHVDYVHNLAVEILCEQGLVGATVFGFTFVLVIRTGVRLWHLHRDDPSLRSVAAILLAICAFDFFNAMKQGNVTSCAPFMYWLVMCKIAYREQAEAALAPLPETQGYEWDAIEEGHDSELAYART